MKTVVKEMLEMINNRSANSLRTNFNKEEKEYWLQKEKQQIIDAYRSGKNYAHENSENYYNETFKL